MRDRLADAYARFRAREAEEIQALSPPEVGGTTGAYRQRDCPCCGAGSIDVRPVLRAHGLDLVDCPGCGLTYSRTVLHEAADATRYANSRLEPELRTPAQQRALPGVGNRAGPLLPGPADGRRCRTRPAFGNRLWYRHPAIGSGTAGLAGAGCGTRPCGGTGRARTWRDGGAGVVPRPAGRTPGRLMPWRYWMCWSTSPNHCAF